MRERFITWGRELDHAGVVRVQRGMIGALLLAAVLGMVGGTWDAVWHVTLRRETFWSPPHLLLYAGTTLALLTAAAGVGGSWLLGWRMPGPHLWLGGAVPVGFAVAAAGSLVVIGAAPLDEFWHRTFGRDVDVWSFPHVVAIAGGVAINVGAGMVVGADSQRLAGPGRGHRFVSALFGAVLIWVAMFSLNWYTLVLAVLRDSVQYPVLASLVGTPALVVTSMAVGRGGATLASALYMVYTAAAHALFASLGYALLPFPPMLIVPALVIDAVLWSTPTPGWRRILVAGLLFAPAFYAAEAASLSWFPHPPLPGPPTTLQASAYLQATLERPWDLAHIAAALPFAMAVSGLSGVCGWWLGSAILWAQGRRPPPGLSYIIAGATPRLLAETAE